jgi:murein DD-endopeptidase MepM/ murein hydrolase activator NlpD
VALIGVATILLGGCSETGSFGNTFGTPIASTGPKLDRTPTGTVATSYAEPQSQVPNFFADAFKPFGDKQAAVSPVNPPYSPRPAPQAAIERPVPPAPISSAPLAPPTPISAPASANAASAVSAPPAASAPRPTYALRSNPNSVGGWSAEGGTPVTVAQGESVETIAQRFGVPADTLLAVNGYSSRTQIQPGARLTIPVYRANGPRVAAAPAPAPEPAKSHQARQHLASHSLVGEEIEGARPNQPKAPEPASKPGPMPAPKPVAVAPAPTKAELAAKEKAERAKLAQARLEKDKADKENAKLAKVEEARKSEEVRKAAEAKTARLAAKQAEKQAAAKQIAEKPVAEARIAEKPLPEKTVMPQSAQAKAPSAAPVPAKTALLQGASAPAPAVLTKPEPAKAKVEAEPANNVAPTPAPAAVAASDSANPEFRWPARGRVIQGFGNGGNDGINIAVPEGTQVKAAESGVVAYAGSELKGYGNLVLIRHPNGFVTAYANNGSLNVKRGESVKRGQVIALSGQSGNVASPQLHFELRKGSKPVDPSTYLAGL